MTQRPRASLSARVEALRQIDNPSTTLSRLIVNLEAGNPYLAIPENRRELDVYLNTAASTNITANAALWVYETTHGFCHVWVETTLSRKIAAGRRYLAKHAPSLRGRGRCGSCNRSTAAARVWTPSGIHHSFLVQQKRTIYTR